MYVIDCAKCNKDEKRTAVCPVDAIQKDEKGDLRVTDDCIDCGACAPECETGAIHPVDE